MTLRLALPRQRAVRAHQLLQVVQAVVGHQPVATEKQAHHLHVAEHRAKVYRRSSTLGRLPAQVRAPR